LNFIAKLDDERSTLRSFFSRCHQEVLERIIEVYFIGKTRDPYHHFANPQHCQKRDCSFNRRDRAGTPNQNQQKQTTKQAAPKRSVSGITS
jgi:hypothetical protein